MNKMDRGKRAKVAGEPSSSEMEVLTGQERAELNFLKSEFGRLLKENEQLQGYNLGGVSMKEIHVIEQKLLESLMRIKKHKEAMFSQAMEVHYCKEWYLLGEIYRLRCLNDREPASLQFVGAPDPPPNVGPSLSQPDTSLELELRPPYAK